MARPPDPLHNRFRAAIEETWRTSRLGVWLMEHHADVARLLRQASQAALGPPRRRLSPRPA